MGDPRRDPFGTPALRGWAPDDCPFTTNLSDIRIKKDLIIEKVLHVILNRRLCLANRRATLCVRLLYIKTNGSYNKTIVRAESTVVEIAVRMVAVDLEARKLKWKPQKRPFFSRWATRFILMIDSNSLLITPRRLMG